MAARRFGIECGQRGGSHFTRTGRPFFTDAAPRRASWPRSEPASASAGLWEELGTDWLVLDCELLPWSAKAEELLRRQYASVGAAATPGSSSTRP